MAGLQDRFEQFLDTHEDQLGHPEAKLVFQMRRTDDPKKLERARSSVRAKILWQVGLGANLGEYDKTRQKGVLPEIAVQRILARAEKMFERNRNVLNNSISDLRRPSSYQGLQLRPEDRFATLPCGETLEEVLLEMASKRNSLYLAYGYRKTERDRFMPFHQSRNLSDVLQNFTLSCTGVLPEALFDALFAQQTHAFQSVHDGKSDKRSPETLPLEQNDIILIIEWRKNNKPKAFEADYLAVTPVRITDIDEAETGNIFRGISSVKYNNADADIFTKRFTIARSPQGTWEVNKWEYVMPHIRDEANPYVTGPPTWELLESREGKRVLQILKVVPKKRAERLDVAKAGPKTGSRRKAA